jgi:hypothetical protein
MQRRKEEYYQIGSSGMFRYRMTVTKISNDSFGLLLWLGFDATTLFLQLEDRGIDRSWTAWIWMWACIARLGDTLSSNLDGRGFCHNFPRFFSREVQDSHIEVLEIFLGHEDEEEDWNGPGTFVDNGRLDEP